MLNQNKIDQIFMECYKKMYEQAEPKADIGKIIKSGEGKMPNFFMAYYLSEEETDKIIDEVCSKWKVSSYERSNMRTWLLLGASPCGNREIAKKYRKTHKKRMDKFLKNIRRD